MAKVIIEGFDNIEDAQIFVDWYSGSGEQDSELWFEESFLQKETKRKSAYVKNITRKEEEIVITIK